MILEELIDFLEKLNTQDLRWEADKLRAIREWSFRQAGIDYREGDKVCINDGYAVARRNSDGSFNGRWLYRECLVGGATGTAVRIDFSPHSMTWMTELRLDREWSVNDFAGKTTWYWSGPKDDTPEGYVPPSDFDREYHPGGRRHLFMFRADNLHRATGKEATP